MVLWPLPNTAPFNVCTPDLYSPPRLASADTCWGGNQEGTWGMLRVSPRGMLFTWFRCVLRCLSQNVLIERIKSFFTLFHDLRPSGVTNRNAPQLRAAQVCGTSLRPVCLWSMPRILSSHSYDKPWWGAFIPGLMN